MRKHEWPLTGAHQKADCFECHSATPPVYRGLSKACVDCHRREYDAENAKEPSHATAVELCERCHSTNAWDEWPGHAKGDRTPAPTSATPTAPPASTISTAPVATTPRPAPRPTPKPQPTAKPPATSTPPAPTPAPAPAPTSTGKRPTVVSGASRK